MRKTKKTLAILAIVAMVLAMIPVQVFAATTSAADSDRYAGADRIATALTVAANWTSADAVVLAPADDANLVDALAAAPLAGQDNAPILLTYKDGLNADVKAKIAALGAKKVYVVGAAANDAVVNALTGVTVEKLAGADRWATAAAINAKLTNVAGTFVVGYDAIPDALSAASFAAANKYQIALTNVDGSVDASRLAGSKTYLVGGTGVVKDYAGATRFGGADRYATNEEVVKGLTYEFSKVYIANGETLVDALVAAPLAAQAKAAVLLANTSVAGASYVNGKLSSTSKVIALGGTGVVSDAVKAGVVYTAPAVLSVESVSAINLKEIVVAFNGAVDKTTAETAANYTVKVGATTKTVTAKVNADLKSVTLTLAAGQEFTNQDAFDVTVENVKNTAAAVITKTTLSGVAFDTILPTAVSAKVTGPTTVEVTFSEPIKTAGTYKLNNGTYYVSANVADGSNKVTLNVASLPEGNYTLNVADAVDFANFKSVSKDLTFTFAKDIAAPTVTLDSISQTKAVIKFNEPITTNAGSLSVYHTYNNVAAYVGAASLDATDKQTLTVTFSNPLPTGAVTLFVNNATTNQAADAWGNAFVSTTLAGNVVTDVTAPTVTSVTQVDSTNLDVTFSEAVTGANVVSYYTLKDSTDTAISINSATQQGTTNTYRLNTAILAGGTYTLSIAGDVIKDTSYGQNKFVAYTTPLTVTDKVAPTVDTSSYSSDTKKVQVNFSEAMDASALTASNYQIAFDGVTRVALPTGTTVAWGSNNKSVIFTFPAAQTFSGTPKVYVAQLSDLAGNKTTAFENVVNVTAGNITASNIVADSVKAVAADTIQFQLDTALNAIDVNKVKINNVAAVSATYVNDGGKATVTVKTTSGSKFATDLSDLNATAISIAAGGLTSSLGTANSGVDITVANTAVKDYVVPTIVTRTIADTDADSKYDTVTVTFSEALQASSVAFDAFAVEGYTVSNVVLSSSGKVATISLTEKASADLGTTPKVQLVKAVRDNSAQFNTLVAETAGTAVTASTTGVAGTASVTTQGVTAVAGVDTLTFGGTWAAADTVTIDGTVLTGAAGASTATTFSTDTTTATAIATAVKATVALNATLNAKYSVTDNLAGVLTFTQKAGQESATALTGTKTSTAGTLAAANTTPGVAGVAEVATLAVSAGATNAGSIAVTVNGVTTYVAVAAADSAAQVATKIAAAVTVSGYNVTASAANVLFTATATGVQTDLVITLAN